MVADIGGFFGSPVWPFLGPFLAVAGIVVSIWLSRRARTRKALSYEIKTTSLVSIHSAAEGHIQVLYEGEQIELAHLVEARIENSGNVPVQVADFDQPITFDLGEDATALTVEVTNPSPSDLRGQVAMRGEEVELVPLLLNPGDGLTLKIIASNLTETVKCHYRIVGITRLDENIRDGHQDQSALQRLSNYFAGSTVLSASSSIAAGLFALIAISITIPNLFGHIDFSSHKTEPAPALKETKFRFRGDRAVCGTEISTEAGRILIRERDGRSFRRVPVVYPVASLISKLPNSC